MTALSTFRWLKRSVFLVILLVIHVFVTRHFFIAGASLPVVITIAIAWIALIFWLYKSLQSADIYYDSANMYLKNYKGVITIPLGEIVHIGMNGITTDHPTLLSAIRTYEYVIRYYGRQGLSSVSFTVFNTPDLKAFEETVKKVNSLIRINRSDVTNEF